MKHISFEGSFPSVEGTPKSTLPEFAFSGRSNVGKSSLINYLCNKKNLAHTSGTPGKTRMINLFNVDQRWILADLPGYGYAKISKKIRSQLSRMITDYLIGRENLYAVFQLIDLRHEPQPMDMAQINWMGEHEIPFAIVFTKTDKLKPAEIDSQLKVFEDELSKTWSAIPPMFVTSATGRTGGDAVIQYIEEIINA